jgi:hypothetical protein
LDLSGHIYLRSGADLIPMRETVYEAEADLQLLLEQHPDLLAGDQMHPTSPRRWVLVAREASVPDAEGGIGRWALDHLFVDQDAVPTLVEVKRSSDTRLRREVIGQMLDYAANGVAYWPVGELRSVFDQACRARGVVPESVIGSLLDIEVAAGDLTVRVDEFWQSLASNLSSKRLRLVFVADVIPRELQRIVEFLNESMSRTEVFAVEVKQFASTDGDTVTLVPRVIGRTAASEDAKRSRSRPNQQWDEISFSEAIGQLGEPGAKVIVADVLEWMASRGLAATFGQGGGGPLYVQVRTPDGTVKAFDIQASDRGRVEVLYNHLSGIRPFTDPAARLALNARLNAIAGVTISDHTAESAFWSHFKAPTSRRHTGSKGVHRDLGLDRV